MRYDRDELLARTDLADLADELLGYHVGNGRNARWPSPVPNHPQTGRTPPMSIFVDHRGIERWTCFATGVNGTAIDLVMTATGRSVGEAMTWLAKRVRLDRPPFERPAVPKRRPPEPPQREPSSALRAYVEACERFLWKPEGEAIRRWLVEERFLDAEVLRHNRIGADPGPRTLRRAKGLPRHGPAAVFPALDEDRQAVYLQARYLDPPPYRGKYDNPTGRHGANPRVAAVEPPTSPTVAASVITEGVPDALAAATGGFRALAVLGAAAPDRRTAARLAARTGPLVVCFDADEAGRRGAERLRELLADLGRSHVGVLAPPGGDLNAWLKLDGAHEMHRRIDLSVRLASAGDTRTSRGRSIA